MAGRLADRTAVVTGGSAGIGQEIARRLAAEGADIAVADVDPADETRASLVRTATAAAKTDEAFFEQTVRIQHLKRLQLPADVSGVVAFLASDDAAFVTGRIIVADGGSTRR